jgi:hypothetical protein
VFDDQRGVSRPQHHACDAGAYEYVFTTQDLVNLLVLQLQAANAGNGFVQQARQTPMMANYNLGMACNSLSGMGSQIALMAMRGQIDPMRAAGIVHTIEDIRASLGC